MYVTYLKCIISYVCKHDYETAFSSSFALPTEVVPIDIKSVKTSSIEPSLDPQTCSVFQWKVSVSWNLAKKCKTAATEFYREVIDSTISMSTGWFHGIRMDYTFYIVGLLVRTCNILYPLRSQSPKLRIVTIP